MFKVGDRVEVSSTHNFEDLLILCDHVVLGDTGTIVEISDDFCGEDVSIKVDFDKHPDHVSTIYLGPTNLRLLEG